MAGHMAQAAFNDPGVQAQMKEAAYQQAQVGMQAAREGAATAVSELRHYVQEGPAGISVLCFLGGIATTLIGVLGLLSITDSLTSPFQYVLNAYLTVFGIVTFLLEADVESVRSLRVLGRLSPWVERYQMEVFNRANFLTELRGRGFFYTFIGTLAITQCLLCLHFLAGVWNLLMGILCLMMSFGINPADHMDMSQPPGNRQPQELPLVDVHRGYP
ncbi:unnamed protein product [Polarella glacialis]|uniref:Uncharacterized protein n=2 Tax=Polarella glacialis TaxID=89957 RepID=A0A813JQ14_POLGL|nr:unnamed protein product [Polarella glacialis]CAE8681539.1 unnamed protein product [Polarella glacialis]